jgi:hypothetical protein
MLDLEAIELIKQLKARYFRFLDGNIYIEGTAIDKDQYVKEDGEWKISFSKYDRLFEEITPRNESAMVTSIPVIL